MYSNALSNQTCRFIKNRDGNTAMMFGLMVIPFVGILGFASDYALALSDKSQLDAASDAASLAAVRSAQNIIQVQGGTRSAAMAAGQTQALSAFASNSGRVVFGTAPTPSITWTAGTSGQTLTANVTYSMVMTNSFSKIIGLPTTTVRGTSVATVTMPSYINYYIITDTSQSMGVGATTQDMTNLYNRVIQYNNYDTSSDAKAGVGCVFGCHVKAAQGFNQPETNEDLAHNTPKSSLTNFGPFINLRIDSAKSAIKSILQDAITASQQSQPNAIKIGLYTMQADPTTNPTMLIRPVMDPPSNNFLGMMATGGQVDSIDLGNNLGSGVGDSDFVNSLTTFTSNYLGSQGDGSSSSSPINYVFIITDGLYDVPGNCFTGHCTNAFNDTYCNASSSLAGKAHVGIIYTTYNPIYLNQNYPSQGLNDNYNTLVANYVNAVPVNLKNCAYTPSYYFEAQDGPAITTGMRLLFKSSASQTRLSQ